MAKKKAKNKTGEQLDLIDVQPENAKELVKAARIYKKYQTVRIEALAVEVEQKKKICDLIKKSGLQRLPNGSIKFKDNGIEITVTPCDDKVKVKDKTEDE